MMVSIVNVETSLFWGREVKDNVCYRSKHQVYNWNPLWKQKKTHFSKKSIHFLRRFCMSNIKKVKVIEENWHLHQFPEKLDA